MTTRTTALLTALLALTACTKNATTADTTDPPTPKIISYIPAPGQFINDGFTCTTEAQAIAWAQSRLDAGQFISLGTFGGTLTLDAQQDIPNKDGDDFTITGNAFSGNSEPGVVWVSSDGTDWFQLKGNDTEYPGWSVTYRQTADAGPGDIQWTDNQGNSGIVSHLKAYHAQSYWPLWVTAPEYTLTGTRLENRLNANSDTGLWQCGPYASGYADIFQNDGPYGPNTSGFDISNAIDDKGNSVSLSTIRYIKVQSAVIAPESSPVTGEVSTEITNFNIL